MSALGLTQADVSRRGGPSDTTLRKILDGDEVNVSTATLTKLDTAFAWTPGTAARAALQEGDSVAQVPEPPRTPPAPSEPRRQHGAWALGPELMVALDLSMDRVESIASGITLAGDPDDRDEMEQLVSDVDDLVAAIDDLEPIARAIAEYGVGGRTHLMLEKAKEKQRRRSRRRPVIPDTAERSYVQEYKVTDLSRGRSESSGRQPVTDEQARAMTDAEIEAAAQGDPLWAEYVRTKRPELARDWEF